MPSNVIPIAMARKNRPQSRRAMESKEMDITERLRDAIESAEVIRIIYHGGSQPGTVRSISPINITNGKLRARCYNSNAAKIFVINNIAIVNDNEPVAAIDWRPGASIQRYSSIAEVLTAESAALIELGWHVENDTNSIRLHRINKAGNPLKYSDIAMDFTEFNNDMQWGDDGVFHDVKTRPRKRPWCVGGRKTTTKNYSTLDKAAKTFMDIARQLAPKPPQ